MRLVRTLLAVALVAPVLAAAQPLAPARPDPRAPLVVTTSWLASHLKDADLVLLHVGDAKEYEARHIPGARYISMGDVSVSDHTKPHSNMLEMPSPDSLRAKLASFGIGDKSRVVVYFGHDWTSPTTRIFMTLNWAGLGDRASLLDGGMDAWVKDGHDVTAAVPPAARPGALSPLRIRNFVVDADFVKSNIGKSGVSIVDGRASVFYDGVQTGNSMDGKQRTGHIASAKSVPFTSVFDATNHLRTAAELEAIFTKAGVGPNDTVIGYCHIGQQTTAMLFAARSLGHPILLYDGSFEDWSRHADYPVENPSAKK
ncbi:MAG: sulfurtransferase [Gemmatimonadetes bacterium]|nr:sulfurtransferase [Gemmatimonadota bacterium]